VINILPNVDVATHYYEGDDLAGLSAGQIFTSADGSRYKLCKLHTVLAGSTTAAGQPLVYVTDGVTVTNDVSIGLDNTNPVVAGVVEGVFAQSAGASGSDLKLIYVLVEGPYATVVTTSAGDITAGMMVRCDGSNDGQVLKFVPSSGNAGEGAASLNSILGWATADDVAGPTVAVWVKPRT
jgi:hypothetical protein